MEPGIAAAAHQVLSIRRHLDQPQKVLD